VRGFVVLWFCESEVVAAKELASNQTLVNSGQNFGKVV